MRNLLLAVVAAGSGRDGQRGAARRRLGPEHSEPLTGAGWRGDGRQERSQSAARRRRR
jgi:hypothetical protein